MKSGRTLTVIVAGTMVLLAGCHKNRPAPPAPAAQPPVIEQPQPTPQPTTTPPQPQPQPQPQPETAPPPATTTTAPKPATTTAPKSKLKSKKTARKTEPTTKKPSRTVVESGGANEPGQISAAIPQDQVTQQRQSTAQLLDTTEGNLKSINRQLSADEQTTVQQIRSLMQQSRAATNAGDTERAFHLALKAHLLSDELVKGR